MKKGLYLLVLVTLSYSPVVKAQDIHFSQIYETPLYLSPANTGFFNGYVRAIANYREQWKAMSNAFQTMGLSVDGGVFKSKKRPAFMGVGFTLFNDKAGAAKIRTTNFMLNLACLVKLGKKSRMSVGLAGGATTTGGDYTQLIYESQFNGNNFDPSITSGENPYRQYTTADVSTGVAYEFIDVEKDSDHDDVNSFKISFGAYHLNKPNQEYGLGSKYRLPVRLCYALTTNFDLRDTRFTLNPTAVYQTQGSYAELMLGSFVRYRLTTGAKVTSIGKQNAIGFGLFFRNKDAIIPKLAVDIGEFSVGMSYDVNLSSYRTATNGNGGFEISLRYNDLANSLFESRKEYR